MPFAGASFDVAFSKDSMVQIPDKPAIFAEVLRVLRPGGRFIASDWLRGGTADYSAEMMEFFRLEGIAYNMASLDESAAALHAFGFHRCQDRDRHGWYAELAQRELEAMEGTLNALIVGRIGEQRAQHFIDNWRQLVVVLEARRTTPRTPESDQATIAAISQAGVHIAHCRVIADRFLRSTNFWIFPVAVFGKSLTK